MEDEEPKTEEAVPSSVVRPLSEIEMETGLMKAAAAAILLMCLEAAGQATFPRDIPLDARRAYLQAELQHRADKNEEALANVQAALKLAPKYVEAHHLYQDIREALGQHEQMAKE